MNSCSESLKYAYKFYGHIEQNLEFIKDMLLDSSVQAVFDAKTYYFGTSSPANNQLKILCKFSKICLNYF